MSVGGDCIYSTERQTETKKCQTKCLDYQDLTRRDPDSRETAQSKDGLVKCHQAWPQESGANNPIVKVKKTESRKRLEQKFIFQFGTLNPHGVNERFSFN